MLERNAVNGRHSCNMSASFQLTRAGSMQPTATSSRELILSIRHRLATLSLLQIRLKERHAILRKAYTGGMGPRDEGPTDVIDHFKSMPSDELWRLHEALTAQLGSKLAVEKVQLAERERRLRKLLEFLDTGAAKEPGSKRLASLP
jgi:hypothetical protein